MLNYRNPYFFLVFLIFAYFFYPPGQRSVLANIFTLVLRSTFGAGTEHVRLPPSVSVRDVNRCRSLIGCAPFGVRYVLDVCGCMWSKLSSPQFCRLSSSSDVHFFVTLQTVQQTDTHSASNVFCFCSSTL